MATPAKGDRRRRFREGAPAPAKAKTRKTTTPKRTRKGTTSSKGK